MYKLDYNIIMSTVLAIRSHKKLEEADMLIIVADFPEGVELDYLITRLYLLNVAVSVREVKKMMWKLIDQGRIELTIDRKLKFIQ